MATKWNVRSAGLWTVKGLVALVFFGAGLAKLVGVPMLVHEFDVIGLGQGFRLLTGAVEVTGAGLLLVPRTSRFGALILFCVSVGAFIAQATRLHGDVIHTIVLIAATGALTWITWRPASAASATRVQAKG